MEISRADYAKKVLFSSKTIAQIKKFKYDPPKVRFLRPNKVLGAKKSFLGPLETQKK